MTETVLVYKGKEIAAYGFGDPHPFGTDRHDVFHAELDQAGLNGAVEFGHARPALVDELALFHTAEYIDKVSRMSGEGRGYLDHGDTPAVKGIYEAASNVVGAVLCAVDELMHDHFRRAFVPIAGLHHAARDGAAGFCVFNDCGIAVEYLRKTYGLQRIAYVDIDAHHGDGVFYGFEDDPDLIFADIHEDGRYLYPGTGHAHETGAGQGPRHEAQHPAAPGCGRRRFRRGMGARRGLPGRAAAGVHPDAVRRRQPRGRPDHPPGVDRGGARPCCRRPVPPGGQALRAGASSARAAAATTAATLPAPGPASCSPSRTADLTGISYGFEKRS